MEWYWTLSLMFGSICVLLAIGLPVAFAFFLTNIIASIVIIGGSTGLTALIRGSMASINNINLVPIPLFLFMGDVLLRTGMAFRAIDAIDRLISRVPGRLAVVAVTGGTIFSALSGSTIATTAMLGQALVPDMLKRGYHPKMAMGPIMAIGGVDMLIPPSVLTVLFATLASGVSITKLSVADLLIAGILPGLVMSAFFVIYIIVECYRKPELAPSESVAQLSGRKRWMPFLIYVVPLLSIFVVVMGSMFLGWASPTDSAALGCLATIVLAMAYGGLSWRTLVLCLKDTTLVTSMALFIVAASTTFAQLLAFSGATDGAIAEITKIGLTPFLAVFCMVVIMLILGCFMDQVSIMLLTLPFFMPLANSLNMDLVWLGIVLLISLQIGLITPPFGMLLFVMKGAAPPHITMTQVWSAALPFVGIVFFVLVLVIVFPSIATLLPMAMR